MSSERQNGFRFDSVHVTGFHFQHEQGSKPDEGWVFDVTLKRELVDVATAETGDARVAVKLAVTVVWNQQPGPFSLEVESVGLFTCSGGLQSEVMRNMCSVHAPALIYSQIRTLVRMMVAEGGHPGFMLPLINVAEHFRDQPLELPEQIEG